MAEDDRIRKDFRVSLVLLLIVRYSEVMLMDTWNFPLQERSRILLRCADLIEKHNDEIAALETWDNGKPYEQAARIEVPMVARLMRYYAGEQFTARQYSLRSILIDSKIAVSRHILILNILGIN